MAQSKKQKEVFSAFAGSLLDFQSQYADDLKTMGLVPIALQPVAPSVGQRDETLLRVTYKALKDISDEEIEDTATVFYRPQSIRVDGAKAHPTPLIESAALASTAPPIPKYEPLLPTYLIKDGVLSESQIETIIYAGEAHSRYIEVRETDTTGAKTPYVHYRQGYMLGDGAGAGKGRTAAGIIFDSWHQGRRKAIWISENDRLYNDAIRDYLALGGSKKNIVKLGRYKIDEPIALSEGVIFCTYATLRSNVKRKDANDQEYFISRRDQIMEWLGKENFDGPVIFDESQNLQNAMESVVTGGSAWGGWALKKPSMQALAALEIQRELPNARVTYASATSGDHLESLAYSPRLGLWGKGTAFADRLDFLKAMEEGGMTALEMICRDLKAMGVYCSRQLTTDGISHEVLVHELTDKQIEQMNTFNKAWRLISTGFEQALVTTGAAMAQGTNRVALALNSAAVGQARSRLEGAKQRFYMLALISMRVPAIIQSMKERLAAGESCILQIHNTQEASLNRALENYKENGGELEDLDLSPRQELIEFVTQCFPTEQQSREKNEKGKDISVPVIDPITGFAIENVAAVNLRDNILNNLEELLVPDSPIDLFMNEFGTDAIAEVTGRSKRVVYTLDENGNKVRVVEKRGKNANAEEIENFNNGPKRILLFSESSGGVGASYHSDRTFTNQTRRNHYLVQIPWRSIDAVQGMGRTNRTNQACPPHYILTTTNVPAELRFISTIARRLDQLGSLTRGQRDANSTYVFSSEDNLETKYGEAGLREMMKVLERDTFTGLTRQDFYQQTGIDPVSVCLGYGSSASRGQTVTIPKFLNRLLAVDIDKNGGYQRLLIDDLLGRIQELKSQAMIDGTYDAGLQTIAPLSLKKIDDVLLRVDPTTGAETRMARLEKVEKTSPTTFAQAMDKLRFFKAFNPNDYAATFAIAPDGTFALHIPVRHMNFNSGPSTEIRVITPFGEKMRTRFDSIRYKNVDNLEEIKTIWEKLIDEGPKTKTEQFYVVYGALLPIWDRFTRAMPKVWRMQTDDGERILGRVIPKHDVTVLKTSFGIATPTV